MESFVFYSTLIFIPCRDEIDNCKCFAAKKPFVFSFEDTSSRQGMRKTGIGVSKRFSGIYYILYFEHFRTLNFSRTDVYSYQNQ